MICIARPRLALATLLLSALILLVPACGADPDDSATTTSAPTGDTTGDTSAAPEITVPAELEDLTGQSEVTINIVDNAFEQRYVKVSPGTEVTWVNDGVNQHNVTPAADDSGVVVNALEEGDTYSQSFAEPGEFPYYCSFHGTPTVGQTGFILVE